MFPVVLGVLAGWRLPLRRWVQVAAGMLSCLVLELVVNWWAHGDPLVRLKVGSEHGSPIADLTRTDALLRFPRAVVAYPQTVVVMSTLVLTVLGALLRAPARPGADARLVRVDVAPAHRSCPD